MVKFVISVIFLTLNIFKFLLFILFFVKFLLLKMEVFLQGRRGSLCGSLFGVLVSLVRVSQSLAPIPEASAPQGK